MHCLILCISLKLQLTTKADDEIAQKLDDLVHICESVPLGWLLSTSGYSAAFLSAEDIYRSPPDRDVLLIQKEN